MSETNRGVIVPPTLSEFYDNYLTNKTNMADFQLPNDQAKVSLWESNSDNEKAPMVSGKVQMTAEFYESLQDLFDPETGVITLDISLWENHKKSSDKSPDFTGSIKEQREREAKTTKKSGGASKASNSMSRSRRAEF